jgi:FAD/FMN-containing dehydrogenase
MSSLADFRAGFKGDLVLPEDADYPAAIARWSITAERNAAIVAFVKTNEDVELAIKYAKANKLPIAIRGGGHNPAGTSSTEGGLVIDLSRHFTGARVDPEKKLVYVGGGALWKTVDEATIKHGLATVAGTVNHVRVINLESPFSRPDAER